MTNLNKKFFVWLLVGLSVCVWVALASICSVASNNLLGLLNLLPPVVTIDCVLLALFVKWIWKWRFLHPWLVPFPNLNGVWKGELKSTYEDKATRGDAASVPTTLTVRQSFTSVSCIMITAEMRSSSAHAGFDLNEEKQQRQLAYIYCSRPKLTLSGTSDMHDGAVVFDILGNPPTRLTGRYWTTRGTAGDIELKRLPSKHRF
jgi:hypothetical protein